MEKNTFDQEYEDVKVIIRDRVETLMEQQGMVGRRSLARKIGLTEDMVSKLLRGERRWKLAHLLRVADALGVPVKDILGGDSGQTIPLLIKEKPGWTPCDFFLNPRPGGTRIKPIMDGDYAIQVMFNVPVIDNPAGAVFFFERNLPGPFLRGDIANYIDPEGMCAPMRVRHAQDYVVLSSPFPQIDDVVFKPGTRALDLCVALVPRPAQILLG